MTFVVLNLKPKKMLNKHIINSHDEGNKSFRCELCDQTFSLKSDLYRHFMSVHETKKPFKCDICDYSFSQKGNLSKHVESVHEQKRPFKCDI